MNGSPHCPEIGVIGLIADRWSPRWQPRHHILTRLARHFHVIWLEPAHEWRQTLTRIRTAPPQWPQADRAPGFVIYRPEPWRPRLFRPARLAERLQRGTLGKARRILTDRGCRNIVLYLWRPDFAPALDMLEHDLSCYHIDDEYSWSRVEIPLDSHEADLITRVDQVFIHSPALMERKGKLNPHTDFVPNGVDYDLHASATPEPLDLAPIPRPRIGYTGYLKTQLDLALLLRLAQENPAWSFVLVGAVKDQQDIASHVEQLSRLRNVHLLGAKPVHELAHYPQHFDVCVMPYTIDGYTRYIYPMKLHEYLASGTPTIGSRIPSLQAFSDVVPLVESPDDWQRAIREALTPEARSPERRAERQAIARNHDWDALAFRVASTMARRLGVASFPE
jgi:glycosyltransferase involved in cell wall biosynthesis